MQILLSVWGDDGISSSSDQDHQAWPKETQKIAQNRPPEIKLDIQDVGEISWIFSRIERNFHPKCIAMAAEATRLFRSNLWKRSGARRRSLCSYRDVDGHVWRYEGKRSRHRESTYREVTVMGGVHGNELLGIELVKWLVDRLESLQGQGALHEMTGNLNLAIGNPEAVATGHRSTGVNTDLNRSFSEKNLGGTGVSFRTSSSSSSATSYEEERARFLAPILSKTDLLIDIHATNKPGPCFARIAGNIANEHYRILNSFSCVTHVLLDPKYTLGGGQVVATDEFVGMHGGIGICIETGQALDLSRLNAIKNDILTVLRDEINLELEEENYCPSEVDVDIKHTISTAVEKDQNTLSSSSPPRRSLKQFVLEEAILLDECGFDWASIDGEIAGSYNFQLVSAGSPIGYCHLGGKDNGSYGENSDSASSVVPISRPFDSYLLFPKIQKLFVHGKPVVWLAKSVSEAEQQSIAAQ